MNLHVPFMRFNPLVQIEATARSLRKPGLNRMDTHEAPTAVNADTLEVAPGTIHEKLEGAVPALASEADLRKALESAFDYRGDVLITRKDGSKIEGYIFDRRNGQTLADIFRTAASQGRQRQDLGFLC